MFFTRRLEAARFTNLSIKALALTGMSFRLADVFLAGALATGFLARAGIVFLREIKGYHNVWSTTLVTQF
ncbi:MAG TPA: hypothetical protein VGK09_03865 [Rhodocyclaceae bacterium]